MKCQILHETKNRMRVHFCKENMKIQALTIQELTSTKASQSAVGILFFVEKSMKRFTLSNKQPLQI